MPINFPDNPSVNDEFQAQGRTWIWNGISWDAAVATIDAGKFIASTNAPENPQQGQGWFDPDTAQFFIYYDNAWIEVGPTLTGPAGASGIPGRFTVSETEPLGAVEGDAWFDATSSRTYIYFDGLWVEVIGAVGPTGPTGPEGPAGGVVRSVRTVSADTTLLSTDEMIIFNGTGPQALTVPDVLSPGTTVKIIQDNTGAVELVSSGTVNLLSTTGYFSASGQNSQMELACLASDEYRLYGDILQSVPTTATGGTIIPDSAYYIHSFTSSGTFQVSSANQDATVDILMVAGGGSGGAGTGGGGGAGGLIYIESYPISVGSYTVTIGAGGTNDDVATGTSGSDTIFTNGARTLTALGGGAGGASETGNLTYAASNGGSGGGAQGYYSGNNTPGTATQASSVSDGISTYAGSGFGNSGATPTGIPNGSGGGGGGAGASATNGSSNGGAGKQYNISGTLSWYAAGGSGGQAGTTSTNGIGGYHVGPSGTAGAVNTGSGGGGGWNHDTGYGGAGGSGIVVVRYAKA
jgi:hypothetical protein